MMATIPRLILIAYGMPAPQGSKRQLGNGVMVESSKKVRSRRQDMKVAAELARGTTPPIDAPVRGRMVFTMPKPRNGPKRRRTWPCRTPKLSEVARSTEDALTDAGVWRNDARVVEYARLAKVYPGEDTESLEAPGVRIEIEVVGDER